jgi:type II secretory pathway predicted ATPase ExeA
MANWVNSVWSSQSPGTQDNIRGGLFVSFVVAIGSGVVRWYWHRRVLSKSPSIPSPPIPRPPRRERFITRYDDKGRELVRRIASELSDRRLVTLYGTGGTGKTTLAIEVANQMFPQPFQGGVIWTAADGSLGFTLIELANTVLIELGHREINVRTLGSEPTTRLARSLLSEAYPCLLALDNFDTIAPSDQDKILHFFETLPCSILVTSRERLQLGQNIRIGTMSLQEADRFLHTLIENSEYPERLARVKRSEIAEVAEYNPLLMQWVVRQLEEAMEPDQVFKDIALGKGEARERIFHRSFRALGADAQTLLLVLALFPTRVTRDILVSVAFGNASSNSDERVSAAIRQLARHDLLVMNNNDISLVAVAHTLAQAELNRDKRGETLRKRITALGYDQVLPDDWSDGLMTSESSVRRI